MRSSAESKPYWRDVGTVDAYWEANIDLTDVVPELDLFDRDWPIWTYSEITPPAKFVHDLEGRRGEAISSLVSGGCILSGAGARRSLLFTGVHMHSFAKVDGAVLLAFALAGAGGARRFGSPRALRHLDRASGLALLVLAGGMALWRRGAP